METTAGNNKVTQTFNLLSNIDRVHPWSIAVALITLGLALMLPRTRLGNFGRLVAIVIPSVLVALLRLDSVKIVREVGDIPRGIPMPHVPSFSSISLDVVTGALAVAVIVLVQGAG